MVDQFYKMRQPIGCNKMRAGFNKLLETGLNVLYPVYCKFTPMEMGINKTEHREENIILSLTSFPARFDKLHICLSTLFRQTLKPDKIILWLYSGECKYEELPKNLRELERYGLEIRFCDENLKPHKKYYYTAKEFPDAVIITVDDDNYYPTWLVQELYQAHLKDRDNIICTISRKISITRDGIGKYNSWNKLKINGEETSYLRIAIGAGGVLYPANCMDEEYYNIVKIKDLALDTDDLWLKFAELRTERKVHVIRNNNFYTIAVGKSQKHSLKNSNVGNNRNDINMGKLIEEYSSCVEILMNEHYGGSRRSI